MGEIMEAVYCSRRKFIKIGGAFATASAPVIGLSSDLKCDFFQHRVSQYLETLAREDGGYGWAGQEDSYLTVTYATVGTYRILGLQLPRPKAAAVFVRKGHPINGAKQETRQHWAELKTFSFEQIQTLLWLNESVESFKNRVNGWKKISSYTTAYETGGNPVLIQEAHSLLCRRLLGLSCEPLQQTFLPYFRARRRLDGSFNTVPTVEGGGGHVVNTWYALDALAALGEQPAPEELVAWVKACQLGDGGFTWCPNPAVGGISDIWYLWAAVRTLAMFNERPQNIGECQRWLQSLWNEDGGFGDRPGAPSSAVATYQVCDSLRLLGLTLTDVRRPARKTAVLSPDLHAYTIQFEAPGGGSPIETVEMAKVLGIHLWGAKNTSAEWVRASQQLADKQGISVKFFQSNEEYGNMERPLVCRD